jgi:hypothetical protein
MAEKLNLWDRIFNRYKTVIIEEGIETRQLVSTHYGVIPNSQFDRKFVKYKKIDRVTGSEEIFQKYLNCN